MTSNHNLEPNPRNPLDGWDELGWILGLGIGGLVDRDAACYKRLSKVAAISPQWMPHAARMILGENSEGFGVVVFSPWIQFFCSLTDKNTNIYIYHYISVSKYVYMYISVSKYVYIIYIYTYMYHCCETHSQYFFIFHFSHLNFYVCDGKQAGDLAHIFVAQDDSLKLH